MAVCRVLYFDLINGAIYCCIGGNPGFSHRLLEPFIFASTTGTFCFRETFLFWEPTTGTLCFGMDYRHLLVRIGWTLWMQITGTLDFCTTRKHRSMYVKTPRMSIARLLCAYYVRTAYFAQARGAGGRRRVGFVSPKTVPNMTDDGRNFAS